MVVRTELVFSRSSLTPTETAVAEVTREDEDRTAAAADRETGAEEPGTLGALSRLIQDVNDQGLSYAKMSERAVDPESGVKLSKPYLQRLVGKPPANPPSPEQ